MPLPAAATLHKPTTSTSKRQPRSPTLLRWRTTRPRVLTCWPLMRGTSGPPGRNHNQKQQSRLAPPAAQPPASTAPDATPPARNATAAPSASATSQCNPGRLATTSFCVSKPGLCSSREWEYGLLLANSVSTTSRSPIGSPQSRADHLHLPAVRQRSHFLLVLLTSFNTIVPVNYPALDTLACLRQRSSAGLYSGGCISTLQVAGRWADAALLP